MYCVIFHRADGKPNEEYWYGSIDGAKQHLSLFRDDDSGLYSRIDLVDDEYAVKESIVF